MKLFNKVAIIGVGLIGGSIALAIKKKKIADKVVGIGHRKKSINEALKLKIIDEGSLNLEKVKGADLVILATPVGTIIKLLPQVARLVKKDCIVIDTGSTKRQIISLAKRLDIQFVGCHPLAGLETRGVRYAKENLFEDSLCVIVTLEKTNRGTLSKIKNFWKGVGARINVLDARQHDQVLSFVSHLPHAIAFSLINCIRPDYFEFGAGSLKDMTRIAVSDPQLWRDIFLTNREELVQSIGRFKKSLSVLESFIKKNQPRRLESYLKKSQEKRNGF